MTPTSRKRPIRFRNTRPVGAEVAFAQWSPENQRFYADFCDWLAAGGYGESALNVYGRAARMALGWLNKPYRHIALPADLDGVRAYADAHYTSASTRRLYRQGLNKLAEYLRCRLNLPAPERTVNWAHYLGPLPDWLAGDVRRYLAHRRRAWRPGEVRRATTTTLSHLTAFLRWTAAHTTLAQIQDLTPRLWFDYLDARLAAGIKPSTLNGELSVVQGFLRSLSEQGRTVCQRTLRIKSLKASPHLPRDLPLDQLRRLTEQIETEAVAAVSDRAKRIALMDRAWFRLMLHSGLRTAEVQRLCRSDLILTERRVRIEAAKGLKDRIVPLSAATGDALRAYLPLRGPAAGDHVFLYRHQPFSAFYCYERLRTYGRRCGVRATPHQLRHSCATLLLNAGAPVLTVQTILGHKHIDTTLGYARLYDGTVAADYYRAMAHIERRMTLDRSTDADAPPPDSGQLLALVDALSAGTLNERQRQSVRALRAGILALAEAQAGKPPAGGQDGLPGQGNVDNVSVLG